MPFPEEIRTRALVAAARHCCVCHRYKGVKVEVHHIVPEGAGGSNDWENAIPLCFDCHADAGHYNAQHPRGTKFSVGELRAHRSAWYEQVQMHAVESPEMPDLLYCRYIISKDLTCLREVSAGDLSRFSIKNCYLVENEILAFLREVLRGHREEYRHAREWGDTYGTESEVWRVHPDAVKIGRQEARFPYFETRRTPTETELRERVYEKDGITRLLLDAGVPAYEIATVVGYYEECGAARFQELYRLRPLWGAFLAATNECGERIRMRSVVGVTEDVRGLSFRPIETDHAVGRGRMERQLPEAAVDPGATVLIPVSVVLAPLQYIHGEGGFSMTEEIERHRSQNYEHMRYSNDEAGECRLIGPAMRPETLELEVGGVRRRQDVHRLDFGNLYSVSREWAVGSCPHLFYRGVGARSYRYGGELFSGGNEDVVVTAPGWAEGIVIAELESEVTYVKTVSVNGEVRVRGKILRLGERLELCVSAGDEVRISGWYVAAQGSVRDPWRRNEIIAKFLLS